MDPLRELISYLADADAATVAKHTPAAVAAAAAELAAAETELTATRKQHITALDELEKTRDDLTATRDKSNITLSELTKTRGELAGALTELHGAREEKAIAHRWGVTMSEEIKALKDAAIPMPQITEDGTTYTLCPGIGYVAAARGDGGLMISLSSCGEIACVAGQELGGKYEYSANQVVSTTAKRIVTVIFEGRDRKYIADVHTKHISGNPTFESSSYSYNAAGSMVKSVVKFIGGDITTKTYDGPKLLSTVLHSGATRTITENGCTTVETELHPKITRVTRDSIVAYRLETAEGPCTYTFGVDGATRAGAPIEGGLKISGSSYRFTYGAICETYKYGDKFEYISTVKVEKTKSGDREITIVKDVTIATGNPTVVAGDNSVVASDPMDNVAQ